MRTQALLALLLMATCCHGDEFRITAVGSGSMTWEDPSTNGTYTVQWASNLESPEWRSDWLSLQQIAATGGQISARIPMFFRVVHYPISSNDMVLVSGGGQPQGPSYNFYMARYETRHEEYCEFLNDAEANQDNDRGAYLYFAANGDVYMGTNFSDRMMFRVSSSKLIYNPVAAPGSKYTVNQDYLGHPIVGVSWYGALKYCNWLTIRRGRGLGNRCYNEGASPTNWFPTGLTYSQWADGFDDIERLQWVQTHSGYRLPMDHNTSAANNYSEYYKAAAWTGSSNSLFAYGRSAIAGQDANYGGSSDPFGGFVIQTTPCGYYDGSNHGGTFPTTANGNHYGIHDLSGNVAEWMTDGYNGPVVRGGSWQDAWSSCLCAGYAGENKYDTHNYVGFRVVTSTP